jgi:hypothetical protein
VVASVPPNHEMLTLFDPRFKMIRVGMPKPNPNPAGREGKPISVAPYSFDEIVDKMLATPLPSKAKQPKVTKKTARKK